MEKTNKCDQQSVATMSRNQNIFSFPILIPAFLQISNASQNINFGNRLKSYLGDGAIADNAVRKGGPSDYSLMSNSIHGTNLNRIGQGGGKRAAKRGRTFEGF